MFTGLSLPPTPVLLLQMDVITADTAVHLSILLFLVLFQSSAGLQYKYSTNSQSLPWSGSVSYGGSTSVSRNRRAPGTTQTVTEDNHDYYNSIYYPTTGSKYYIDLDTEDDQYTTITHAGLSSAHLTAAPVVLPFIFSFYGHNITAVHIATGGFLYVGTFVHEFLTATQYIAPLMGNFDSSLNGSDSIIRYGSNGTAFTVEWKNIHVNHREEVGGFTFQTTLFDDGRITFAYKKIPVAVSNITGGNGHPVTIGLSDGFYIDEPIYEGSTVEKRTIYSYHVISIETSKVKADAAFELFPLPTCNQLMSCGECTTKDIQFDCAWCPAIEHCSSGLDRNRDDWVDNKCDLEATYTDCPSTTGSATPVWVILLILLICLLVLSLVGWVVYAYRYPNSQSGMFLIESQSFVKGKFQRNSSNDEAYIVDPKMQTLDDEPVAEAPKEQATEVVVKNTADVSEA